MDLPALLLHLGLGFLHAVRRVQRTSTEAVINRVVEKSPYVVIASEGATFDLGLLPSQDRSRQGDLGTDRLRILYQEAAPHEAVVVPLDIKSTIARILSPTLMSWLPGGRSIPAHPRMGTYFLLSPEQSRCHALIVVFPQRPDEVCVVPVEYGRHRAPPSCKPSGVGASWSVFLPTEVSSLDPVPPQWSPFLLPLSSLPQILDEHALFYGNKQQFIRNPSNGLIQSSVTTVDLWTPGCLYPSQQQSNQDIWWLDDILEAFQLYQRGRFRPFHFRTRPFLGDIGILDEVTGERFIIELKVHVSYIDKEGVFHSRFLPPDFRRPHSAWKKMSCRYFSTLLPVDAYLFKLKHPGRRWLFVPRDQLPDEWFVGSDRDHELRFYSWAPDDPHFLSDHTIACDPVEGQQFVRQWETILERIFGRGQSLRTQRKRPHYHLAGCVPDTVKTRVTAPGTVECRGGTVAGGVKPEFGWAAFYAYEIARIQRECQQSHTGFRLIPIAGNSRGRHVFTPVPAANFSELPDSSPLIYLDFFPISLIDTVTQSFSVGPMVPQRLKFWIRNGSSRILILVPCPPNRPFLDERQEPTLASRVRYLVPSQDFYLTEGNASVNGVAGKRDLRLLLKGGKVIDNYAVDVEDVTTLLTQIFLQSSDIMTLGAGQIRLMELIKQKGHVVEGFLRLHQRRIRRKVRRNKRTEGCDENTLTGSTDGQV